jgi:hypothetical protein
MSGWRPRAVRTCRVPSASATVPYQADGGVVTERTLTASGDRPMAARSRAPTHLSRPPDSKTTLSSSGWKGSSGHMGARHLRASGRSSGRWLRRRVQQRAHRLDRSRTRGRIQPHRARTRESNRPGSNSGAPRSQRRRLRVRSRENPTLGVRPRAVAAEPLARSPALLRPALWGSR